MTLSEISEKTKAPLKLFLTVGTIIAALLLWGKALQAAFENHERTDDARVEELKTRMWAVEKAVQAGDVRFEYIKGQLEILKERSRK